MYTRPTERKILFEISFEYEGCSVTNIPKYQSVYSLFIKSTLYDVACWLIHRTPHNINNYVKRCINKIFAHYILIDMLDIFNFLNWICFMNQVFGVSSSWFLCFIVCWHPQSSRLVFFPKIKKIKIKIKTWVVSYTGPDGPHCSKENCIISTVCGPQVLSCLKGQLSSYFLCYSNEKDAASKESVYRQKYLKVLLLSVSHVSVLCTEHSKIHRSMLDII